MKKTGLFLLALLVLLGGVFLWLVLAASPDNAPQDTRVIELPDTYEN